MKQKILFLVNPLSGGKNKAALPGLIMENIDKQRFDPEIIITKSAEHTLETARDAAKHGVDVVVAAGGDGTVHDVAKQLIGSNTALGIIPLGSGNGLARHLKVPLKPLDAIRFLNTAGIHRIDTVRCDGEAFVNIAGAGFDAHISYLFSIAGVRGFKTYVRISMREFWNYKPEDYELVLDGSSIREKAFLVGFANGTQWGNNAVIAPGAALDDGQMLVAVLRPFRFYELPSLLIKLMLTGNIHTSRRVKIYPCKKAILRREKEGSFHVDGEPCQKGKEVQLEVLPQSLNILA